MKVTEKGKTALVVFLLSFKDVATDENVVSRLQNSFKFSLTGASESGATLSTLNMIPKLSTKPLDTWICRVKVLQ